MNVDFKIGQYVICHKDIDDHRFNRRTFLYVNKNIPKKSENGIQTWTLENIDVKNKYYCELTAFYWLLKNPLDVDVISIEHYRRVFVNKRLFTYSFLTSKKISKILQKKQIILPRKHWFKTNLFQQYCENHYESDLVKMRDVLLEKYPEYKEAYEKTMFGHECSLFNMAIFMKKDFILYGQFAFDILDEVFKSIEADIEKRDSYQQRVVGFLSERLFNIWVNHNYNRKDIYYCNVGHLNQKMFVHRIKNFIFKIIRHNHDI